MTSTHFTKLISLNLSSNYNSKLNNEIPIGNIFQLFDNKTIVYLGLFCGVSFLSYCYFNPEFVNWLYKVLIHEQNAPSSDLIHHNYNISNNSKDSDSLSSSTNKKVDQAIDQIQNDLNKTRNSGKRNSLILLHFLKLFIYFIIFQTYIAAYTVGYVE